MDVIDSAIAAAAQPTHVNADFQISSGGEPKAVMFRPPLDLTESEAFALLVHISQVCRQVTLEAEQRKTGGLVLARGPIPPGHM